MVVEYEKKHSVEQHHSKYNNAMSVMLCTVAASFVKKNSCLFARIVSFDTAGLLLITFCIFEPYLANYTELDLSYVISR